MLTTARITELTKQQVARLMSEAQQGAVVKFTSQSTVVDDWGVKRLPVTIEGEVFSGPRGGRYVRGSGTLGTAPFAFERLSYSTVERLRNGGTAPLYGIVAGRERHTYLGELRGIDE